MASRMPCKHELERNSDPIKASKLIDDNLFQLVFGVTPDCNECSLERSLAFAIKFGRCKVCDKHPPCEHIEGNNDV